MASESSRLTAGARKIVEGLLAGKSLDNLTSRGDPVRSEVEAYLTSALSEGPRAVPSDRPRAPRRKSARRSTRPSGSPAPAPAPTADGVAVAYSDGASRGNPGSSAVGIRVLSADGVELVAEGWTIGEATNNVAEYRAAIAVLEKARNLGLTELELRLDSELVVKQLTGAYRVKNADLAELKAEVDRLATGFRKLRVVHVPRAENVEADRLANEALDQD